MNDKLKRQYVKPDDLPPGAIVDQNGVVVGLSTSYKMSTEEPKEGEVVYTIHEAFQGWKKMQLNPEIPKYHVMCTFQRIGGDKDDVGLIILKGMEPPPAGTRFVIRMLPPVGTAQLPIDIPTPEEARLLSDSELQLLVDRLRAANPEAAAILDKPIGRTFNDLKSNNSPNG